MTLAPLAELVRGGDLFGLALGRPAPPEIVARWSRAEESPTVTLQEFVFVGVWDSDDGPRALRPGELRHLRLHCADPSSPVELIELVVPPTYAIDQSQAEQRTGLHATRIAGIWEGRFRPSPDKMYGGHVYGNRTPSIVYATDVPGAFLLEELSAAYVETPGSLYAVLLAEDEATLARGPFLPVATAVARAEQALQDPELKDLSAARMFYLADAWTHELDALQQRIAAAEQAREARRNSTFPTELAALRQRWQQRPRGDIDAARALLAEFGALAGRSGGHPDAVDLGLAERRSLHDDAPLLRERGLLVTAAVCERMPRLDGRAAIDPLLAAAIELDRATDPSQFRQIEERLGASMIYGATAPGWSEIEPYRREAALRVLFAPIGAAAQAPAAAALRDALRAHPQPVAEQVALRDAAAAFDRLLAGPPSPTNLPPAVDALQPRDASTARTAWLAAVRRLAAERLEHAAQQHAAPEADPESAEPAVAACHLLAAYAIENDRWPEPEQLVDVIANGSQAADPRIRRARDLVAPLLVRLLPAFRSDHSVSYAFAKFVALPPIVTWPAFWQLGLAIGDLDRLGDTYTQVTGEPAPHLRVDAMGAEGMRLVPVAEPPLFGSSVLDWSGFAGLHLTAELKTESDALAAERSRLEADNDALQRDVQDFNRRSQAWDDEVAALQQRMANGSDERANLTVLRTRQEALDREKGPLKERQSAINVRIEDHNRRLMAHNDARLRYTGEERARYDDYVRSGLLRWVDEHRRAVSWATADEAAAVTAWLTADTLVGGVVRRPSRGHGMPLFERYAATLLDAGGAEAIGQRLADAFTVLARCEPDAGVVRQRFEPLVVDYTGKLGVDALFDSVAMKVPDDLVIAFTRSLPREIADRLRSKADDVVRKAVEQQQQSLRRAQR